MIPEEKEIKKGTPDNSESQDTTYQQEPKASAIVSSSHNKPEKEISVVFTVSQKNSTDEKAVSVTQTFASEQLRKSSIKEYIELASDYESNNDEKLSVSICLSGVANDSNPAVTPSSDISFDKPPGHALEIAITLFLIALLSSPFYFYKPNSFLIVFLIDILLLSSYAGIRAFFLRLEKEKMFNIVVLFGVGAPLGAISVSMLLKIGTLSLFYLASQYWNDDLRKVINDLDNSIEYWAYPVFTLLLFILSFVSILRSVKRIDNKTAKQQLLDKVKTCTGYSLPIFPVLPYIFKFFPQFPSINLSIDVITINIVLFICAYNLYRASIDHLIYNVKYDIN